MSEVPLYLDHSGRWPASRSEMSLAREKLSAVSCLAQNKENERHFTCQELPILSWSREDETKTEQTQRFVLSPSSLAAGMSNSHHERNVEEIARAQCSFSLVCRRYGSKENQRVVFGDI